MRTCGVATFLALAAMMGTAALAEEGEKANTGKSEKEKVICKTEAVTGSLLRKRRVCLTRQQWDDLASNTKQDIDRYANALTTRPPSGANPAAPR